MKAEDCYPKGRLSPQNTDALGSESSEGLGWCRIFHRWSRWVDVCSGNVVGETETPVGKFLRQERRCARCNKAELRDEYSVKA